jgi:NifU-like protein involved in Fe-S cluster formation
MSGYEAYSERVLALFDAAPGAGAPEGDGWAMGECRDALSGTWVRAYLRVRDTRIDDVRYEVRGCPHTVAAAALTARAWRGVAAPLAQFQPRELLAELDAPVTKLGRMLIVETAYRKALQAAQSLP